MRRIVLFFLCVLAPFAFGATSGVVLSAQSGDAVGGARVVARRAMAPVERRLQALSDAPVAALGSAVTKDDGAFTLEEKLEGVIVLEVEREGFAPESMLAIAGDADVRIELAPAPRRNGRITANGKGVAGARVVAMKGDSAIWSTRTDEQGSYAMPAPEVWCTRVTIVHPDFAPRDLNVGKGRTSLDATLAKGSTVTGRIVDAAGKAVPKARVIGGEWTFATSGEDGAFTLNNVGKDAKTLEAFAGNAYGQATPGEGAITIAIAARPTISGTVRDANKRPLAGAPVIAYRKSRTPPFVTKMAVADDRGQYRIEHCQEGSWTINGYGVGELSFTAIETQAGAKDADLLAKKEEGLRGIVVDEQKRPVAGAIVQYTMQQMPLVYGTSPQQQMPSVRTGRDGRFTLMASEGIRAYAEEMPIRVQASRPGYAIGVSEDLDFTRSLSITLPAGIEVNGVVVDANGRGVAGAGIIIMQDPFGAVPLPLESGLSSGMMKPFIESDAEGKFALRLNAGTHDFAAFKEGIGGARLGGVEIAAGAKPLKIVLEAGVAIHGRVTSDDAKTALAGNVTAVGPAMSFATAPVADDGTFTLEDLHAGDYRLQYESYGGRSAESAAKAPSDDVVIKLEATGTIRGRVVDAMTHEVLRNYTVTSSNNGSFDGTAVENADTFTIDALAGQIELTVEAEGYTPAKETVTVATGKTVDVTISATRGRILRGRVTGEDGTPIADATISAGDSASDYNDIDSTEENGEYRLVLPRIAQTVAVAAKGWLKKTVDVPAGDGDTRIDIVLSRGRQARGRVLTSEGAALEGAAVTASGDTWQQARTNADGTFVVQGLGDGRYRFAARKDELTSEPLENVDIGAGEIVIRMKPSAGTGALRGTVKGFAGGNWMMGIVQAAEGTAFVGRDGTYRFEKLPAGELDLRATATGPNGDMVSAPAVKVTIIAGSEVEADLELRTDISVRGTVYEGGAPAPGKSIQFYDDNNSTYWTARTNAQGEYAVTGIVPGAMYKVAVSGSGRTFTVQHQVSGSERFDIRIEWSHIEGRVADTTGVAIAGAQIDVDGEETKSDAAGAFALTVARADVHVVRVEKDGFATISRRVTPGAAPLLITMTRTDGLRVRLVDARDGRTLSGYAVAVDEAGQLLARTSETGKDGALRVPVGEGNYRIAVSASGYASLSARTAVPRADELRFALTAGGTLVVNTDRVSSDVIKLVMPTGEEYVRCQCNGIAEIRLTGTATTVDHVAPGSYTMQVLDERGLVKASHAIAINEGQTTAIAIHVPE